MLWGRLGYDPDLSDQRLIGLLQDRFHGTDSEALFEAWQQASMIYPKTTGLGPELRMGAGRYPDRIQPADLLQHFIDRVQAMQRPVGRKPSGIGAIRQVAGADMNSF